MALDITDESEIYNLDSLVSYFQGGCKAEHDWRIGTEHEKFPFYRGDFRPVPYEGSRGIRALLEGMQKALGWEPILDEGNIIGLVGSVGQGAISLEPGGQFELSGALLKTIGDTYCEVIEHLALLKKISEPLGIGFLGIGASPKWTLTETPRMPKSRYRIMANYMPKVGHSGLDMMYRTSTVQVNLDFSSETDMRRKMQVSMKLQSIATALFASSPFTEGRPNGFLSWRSEIWCDTDNQRTGVLPFIFSERFGFADYVEWALDVPMYFVVRDGRYYDCTHITFRQFMNGALRGQVANATPNMGDWINHLSTLFPEVRLKRFLEMRGADCGSLKRICALSAFWVGILYDSEALNEAEALTKDWCFEEVLDMRKRVPKEGLKTPFRQTIILEIARQAVAISHKGLKNRRQYASNGLDETSFLAPLEEVIAMGQTDADKFLSLYHSIWDKSVEPVFLECVY
ncbi:glutamate--cysteine ligase [Bartonella henselae]|uniref:Glutamate--cysteine ligase n=3 Tax=Bartonella TaxID=773 RepID=X5M5Z1_BARHN|nr:glutamate--cysteine ligase [Bartonella henselae]ATP12012.1 glutamate--cysteine ligase [Bartonella henselae]ETS07791.1 glutamate-cysteine ligase [Bartonella henselae JK 42]ETS10044.1 glutamate-cysteine ligase [Bartonella henselae JK 50]ETS10554.1 glutamate-cysteine ligase [Bartonella henselae JK 51]ETS12207.1 glutamate-cysteine ligase [Bartonella henselae JK 41]